VISANACWLAAGLSLALAAGFWLPTSLSVAGSTAYSRMEGTSLTLAQAQSGASAATPAQRGNLPQGQAQPNTPAAAPIALPTPLPMANQGFWGTEPPKARVRAAERPQKRRGSPVPAKPTSSPIPVPPPAPASAPAQEAKAEPASAPATTVASQDIALDNIAQKFENDPTKYPLDRSRKMEGVTLTLLAVGRLDRLFVLKVAVDNDTDADFFVKGFSLQAGGADLGSRSSFRILVEPRRSRTGYVLFGQPQPGAAVKIKLKEDGGKGLAIEMPVPYPF
jgi:hypothetical protein